MSTESPAHLTESYRYKGDGFSLFVRCLRDEAVPDGMEFPHRVVMAVRINSDADKPRLENVSPADAENMIRLGEVALVGQEGIQLDAE